MPTRLATALAPDRFARVPTKPDNWFRSSRSPVNAFARVDLHVHDDRESTSRRDLAAPTNAPPRSNGSSGNKRGRRVSDSGGDVFTQEQETEFYRPTGALPGGLTVAEWNAMTPAERTAWVNRVATTDAQRTQLITESVREGLTGVSAIILAIYAGEQARATSAADRDARRLASRDAIELATIQADRDVRIAQARGNSGTDPLTTTPRPTTGAEWDALTPAQQQAAGPRPPGWSKNTKIAVGVGAGVAGLGLLAGIGYAVTR